MDLTPEEAKQLGIKDETFLKRLEEKVKIENQMKKIIKGGETIGEYPHFQYWLKTQIELESSFEIIHQKFSKLVPDLII